MNDQRTSIGDGMRTVMPLYAPNYRLMAVADPRGRLVTATDPRSRVTKIEQPDHDADQCRHEGEQQLEQAPPVEVERRPDQVERPIGVAG